MAVIGLARPRPIRLVAEGAIERLAARRELAWLLLLIVVAVAAHAWNMFNFPYFEDDEGTYVSQAWALFGGRLAPYTYWYDHPPLGWIQLGLLSLFTGGFNALGSSVATGRLFMLLYQVGSVALVYYAARGSGRSVAAASVAVLAFSLSGYGLYLHRRVLLDNIAAFWLILSIALLMAPRWSLTRVWLSAAALGIGILSKEIVVIAVPALALLVGRRSDRPHRLIAVTGWVGLALGIASTWVLFAVLKGELFPVGSPLGGTRDHVSLIGTLLSQAARDKDGGILQLGSGFWHNAWSWISQDPLLVVGGTVGSLLAVLRFRSQPAAAAIGLVALSIWMFLGRGGITIGFYLVPALPVLAIGVAWLVDEALVLAKRVRPQGLGRPVLVLMLGLLSLGTLSGYRDSAFGYRSEPTQLWTSQQSNAGTSAVDWVRANIPTKAGIVTDMYAWLDLHAPPPGTRAFDLAHYYWKVDLDPEIRSGVFSETWKTMQYLVVTGQMRTDATGDRLPLVQAALAHATEIRRFDSGGWPVSVQRVNLPQSWPAADDHLLHSLWTSSGSIADPATWTASMVKKPDELATLTLLGAVYMDDRPTFERFWNWSKAWAQSTQKPDARPGIDTDAAVALAFAGARWNQPAYRAAARQLIDRIWRYETVVVPGGRIVVSGTPAGAGDGVVRVDLSAISPYAYRMFGAIDRAHPWGDVIDGSYRLLAAVQAQKDMGGQAGLVPHWVGIEPASGRVVAASLEGSMSVADASASQVGWRVGLDWLWNHDERAQQVLLRLSNPQKELSSRGWLARGYRLNGEALHGRADIAGYTAALPPVLFGGDVERASSTFTKFVLAPALGPNADAMDPTNKAWAWLGTALMDGALVDLTRNTREINWSDVDAPSR